MKTGNVHNTNVTEAQVAFLKAVTPHIIAMSAQERQQLIIGNPRLPVACGALLRNHANPLSIKVDRTLSLKSVAPGLQSLEKDMRSDRLCEVDFAHVDFVTGMLPGEEVINGDDKLERLKKLNAIRLDAAIGLSLVREPEQVALRCIRKCYNIKRLEFTGSVLEDKKGTYFLGLDGRQEKWETHLVYISYTCNAPSPLLTCI